MPRRRGPAKRPAPGALRPGRAGSARVVACVMCGILLGCSFLVPMLSWMAWVAVILLLGALDGRKPGASFLLAWCAGVVLNAVATHWLPETITRFSDYATVTSVLMFAGYCALVGLQLGLFGLLLGLLRCPATSVAVPALWVCCEIVFPHLFPWALGYSQFNWLTVIQISEWTGAYGVSFMMMWFAVLGLRLVKQRQPRRAVAAHGLSLLSFAVVLGMVLGFGWWRQRSIARYLADRPSVNVALIQPGLRPWIKGCVELSGQAPAATDLICWPESAVPGYVPLGAEALPLRGSWRPQRPGAGGRRGTWLLAGASTRLPDSTRQGPFLVSALLIDSEDHIIARYHKRTLMPFGEYIPGERWWPALHRFAAFPDRFIPGRSDRPLSIEGLIRAGVLICYEDLITATTRVLVQNGADILVNLTNDFWFGESTALNQHMRFAVFRAVENRRYLLRCTTTGATVVVSPTGRLVGQAPPQQPHRLTAAVQGVELLTFYTRFGNVFAWTCVLVTGGLAGRRWRRRGATPGP